MAVVQAQVQVDDQDPSTPVLLFNSDGRLDLVSAQIDLTVVGD